MALLEVKNICKDYSEAKALRNVSLSVESGEVFGLLGANGAGKTTLLSILACLLDASSGEVRLLDQPVQANNRNVRRLVGLVPQELAIYEELTARENLVFFGELYGISGKTLADRVDRILEATRLADRAQDRARTFSGGMKRRLNLGVALVHEPKLLLLDEPTVGIDPQSRNHIFDEVRRLNREGLTIVYTSHYMEEVESLCSRIAIMDQGELMACDSLKNLLAQHDGVIRMVVSTLTPELRQRLKSLPQTVVKFHTSTSWSHRHMLNRPAESNGPNSTNTLAADAEGILIEFLTRDSKATLVRLITLLHEANVEMRHLETEEPSLERVFLDLTGRALRD